MDKSPTTKGQGITCPKCLRHFQNDKALRMHNARVHTKTIVVPTKKIVGIGKGGNKWIPGQLERFRASMRRRRLEKQRLQRLQRKPRQIRHVYPLPQDQPVSIEQAIKNTWPDKPSVRDEETKSYIRAQLMRHCPKCGHDLHQWEVKTGNTL